MNYSPFVPPSVHPLGNEAREERSRHGAGRCDSTEIRRNGGNTRMGPMTCERCVNSHLAVNENVGGRASRTQTSRASSRTRPHRGHARLP